MSLVLSEVATLWCSLKCGVCCHRLYRSLCNELGCVADDPNGGDLAIQFKLALYAADKSRCDKIIPSLMP